MQEIIDRIAAEIGVAPDVAHKATSMIVAFIVTEAPAEYVDAIRQNVPGFDELVATGAAHTEAAEASSGGTSGGGLMGAFGGLMGGGGGLMGALGGLMGGSQGGGLAGALSLLGRLQQDGLDIDQVKTLAGGLLGELRQVAGEENVAKLVSGIPGADRLLG